MNKELFETHELFKKHVWKQTTFQLTPSTPFYCSRCEGFGRHVATDNKLGHIIISLDIFRIEYHLNFAKEYMLNVIHMQLHKEFIAYLEYMSTYGADKEANKVTAKYHLTKKACYWLRKFEFHYRNINIHTGGY